VVFHIASATRSFSCQKRQDLQSFWQDSLLMFLKNESTTTDYGEYSHRRRGERPQCEPLAPSSLKMRLQSCQFVSSLLSFCEAIYTPYNFFLSGYDSHCEKLIFITTSWSLATSESTSQEENLSSKECLYAPHAPPSLLKEFKDSSTQVSLEFYELFLMLIRTLPKSL
jgi:hypothetical protein